MTGSAGGASRSVNRPASAANPAYWRVEARQSTPLDRTTSRRAWSSPAAEMTAVTSPATCWRSHDPNTCFGPERVPPTAGTFCLASSREEVQNPSGGISRHSPTRGSAGSSMVVAAPAILIPPLLGTVIDAATTATSSSTPMSRRSIRKDNLKQPRNLPADRPMVRVFERAPALESPMTQLRCTGTVPRSRVLARTVIRSAAFRLLPRSPDQQRAAHRGARQVREPVAQRPLITVQQHPFDEQPHQPGPRPGDRHASGRTNAMPLATPETYAAMLDRAKDGGFAYPAINVTSSITINAALRGFAEAGSDGIIQASTGGAEFASGTKVKDMVTGAVGLAEFTKVVADKYGITVALHTDHCPKDKLDTYVKPLIAISTERVKAGGLPLFQSHMWDGSAVPLDENLQDRQGTAGADQGGQHHPGDRGRRRRRRGGRRRRRDQREALHLARRLHRHPRCARPAGGQLLHRRRDVRQRARRLQAGRGQAAPGGAQDGQDALAAKLGLAGRLEAVLPGVPRRLRLVGGGDRRGGVLRRHQDEHRHRHPVRLHPAAGRSLLHATTTAC